MNHRSALLAAGILGATGVGLGAFGAHGLREMLTERGMTNAWETAARYHLLHAVALLGLAAWLRGTMSPDRLAGWTGGCWIGGTIAFAGSLYAFALGGPHWLVFLTPLGGTALVAGWILLVVAGMRKERTDGNVR